ncbi:hypothetical protein HK405_007949, partial [Cladochytrium tenue]
MTEAITTTTPSAATIKSDGDAPHGPFEARAANEPLTPPAAVTASVSAHQPPQPPSHPTFLRSLAISSLPPTDPALWPPARKRLTLSVVAVSAMLPGFCSTVYLPGVPDVREDLQTSSTLVTLTLSLFILFMGVGPFVASAVSDAVRRRRAVYLLSLLLFVAASVGCYFVGTIEGLIVLRCLQSIGASTPVALGAGTVADIYYLSERGAAVGIVSAGGAIGPLLGPILGGIMTEAVGWRFTFLVSAALGAACFLAMFLGVPETFRLASVWGPMPLGASADGGTATPTEAPKPAAADAQEARNSEDSGGSKDTYLESRQASSSLSDPTLAPPGGAIALVDGSTPEPDAAAPPAAKSSELLGEDTTFWGGMQSSLKLLTVDYVLITAVTGSIPFAIAFTLETLIPTIYEEQYGLTTIQTGLSYLSGGFCNLLASIVSGRISDYNARISRQRRELAALQASDAENSGSDKPGDAGVSGSGSFSRAEDRITPFTLACGYLHAGLSLAAPIIGFGLVCFGFIDGVITSMSYLVDALNARGLAASGSAVAILVRNLLACVLSVVATPWMDAIGIHWLGLLVAAFSVVATTGLLALKVRGGRMRARHDARDAVAAAAR